MIITQLPIHGAAVVKFTPFSDERGEFVRLFCAEELRCFLQGRMILQINKSTTKAAGMVRGLHFQYPPKSEMKLLQSIKGRVFDVLVDIRKNSPTYLSWVGVELSPELRQMVIIPEGCAHGFQALENEVEVLYFSTEYYSPEFEGGIRYDDPKIGIDWPVQPLGVITPNTISVARLIQLDGTADLSRNMETMRTAAIER